MTPSQLDMFAMDCEIAGLRIYDFQTKVKSAAWAVKPSFARPLCLLCSVISIHVHIGMLMARVCAGWTATRSQWTSP